MDTVAMDRNYVVCAHVVLTSVLDYCYRLLL